MRTFFAPVALIDKLANWAVGLLGSTVVKLYAAYMLRGLSPERQREIMGAVTASALADIERAKRT